MVRNLTAAEPSIDPELERLMDTVTPEPDRGDLPDEESTERQVVRREHPGDLAPDRHRIVRPDLGFGTTDRLDGDRHIFSRKVGVDATRPAEQGCLGDPPARELQTIRQLPTADPTADLTSGDCGVSSSTATSRAAKTDSP